MSYYANSELWFQSNGSVSIKPATYRAPEPDFGTRAYLLLVCLKIPAGLSPGYEL